MPDQSTRHCLNCGAELHGDFCHECGQSARVKRLTFLETLQDFFSSSFALEGPLFRTIRGLLANPGQLYREYLGGKRKTYYKPVAFFILLTAIYIVVRSLINYDSFGGNPPPSNGPENRRIFAEAAFYMVKNINNILFFLVLSIGLFQKLFFYKRYNLTEYLTIGFYITGIYIVFGMLVAVFSTYVYQVNPQINLVILFLLLVYNAYSLHQRKSFWSIVKYPIVSFLSIIGYMILGYGFSLLIVYLRS